MQVRIGNIFESKMQTIVNTINCVGVMGKGIALEFKNKYPNLHDLPPYPKNKCLSTYILLLNPILISLSLSLSSLTAAAIIYAGLIV